MPYPYELYYQAMLRVSDIGATQLNAYLDKDGALCCMLHGDSRRVELQGVGCGDAKLGFHPAIKAFHESGVVVCHAYDGQKVLDNRVAKAMHDCDPGFFKDAWARTGWFMGKYMGGGYATFPMYGAGYCYLRFMEGTVRSRLARVLGPVPYVADVVKAYVLFAYVKGNRLAIREVAPGYFHVVNSRVFSDATVLLRELVEIVERVPDARIGIYGDSSLFGVGEGCDCDGSSDVELDRLYFDEDGLISYGNVLSPYSAVVVSHRTLVAAGVLDEVRGDALQQWFHEHNICFSQAVLGQLMLATSAAACIGGANASGLKSLVKMWAVLGDVEMKRVVAQAIISEARVPADYTAECALQTNSSLAGIFDKCGLRKHCAVEGLAVDSSANATMFEAVVGVISSLCREGDVHDLLRVTGLMRREVSAPGKFEDDASVGSLRLNSRQYLRVVEMLSSGML